MIILSSTTDKIQVKLGSNITTNQLECFVSYRDTTSSSITPLRNALSTNNTTAVDLVSSPASSTQRIVDYISVFNTDTVNSLVTVQFSDNGTLYTLFEASIATGEKIEYQEGSGFKTITSLGSIKSTYTQGIAPTSGLMNMVVLSGDITNSNAVANTIADVTGLSFAVTAGKSYWFRFIITYTAAATTTGSRWSINGPSTSYLSYYSLYSLTTTTQTINYGVNGYDTPAASNTSSPSTAGNTAIIEGQVTPSVNGTIIARFASEVSNSAVVAKTGSVLFYQNIL